MEPYISKVTDGIAHCPYCRGVILKDFKADPEAKKTSFFMRCAHCQKDILVELQNHHLKVCDKKSEQWGK